MADYLSGSIKFTGLGSGTDFETMIDQLMELEATHQNQLESWKSTWEAKIEALENLNSAMVSLKTTLAGMDEMNTFMAKESSSSNETVLTALATADADTSSHNVEVVSMARNSIWVSGSGVATEDTPIMGNLREGEIVYFNLSYDDPNDNQGASVIEVAVTNKTTLSSFVGAINSSPENNGVKAAAINNGSSYYLQVRGMDLGSNANLQILTQDMGGLGRFSELQSNADAKLRVDGWPEDDYIHASSNTVTNAIDGVALTLKNTGSVQVTTSLSTGEIVDNVQTFVNQMNQVRALALQLTKVESDSSGGDSLIKDSVAGSVMTGNYAVQLTMSNLKSITTSIAPGFVYYDADTDIGDPYTSLSQLGIYTDADESSETSGLLILDETVLEEALLSNANAVAEVFAANGIGDAINDTGSFNYKSSINGVTEAGVYDVSYEIDSSGNIFNAYIGGTKANINNDDRTITAMEGNARGLEVQINDVVPGGPYTGEVRLKQGKLPEIADLLSDITNEDTGTLNIVVNNYEDIINSIDDKIAFEETRIETRRDVLVQKYARLESLLGQYDSLSSAVTSQIAQLSSS